jgi:hypothetical protein
MSSKQQPQSDAHPNERMIDPLGGRVRRQFVAPLPAVPCRAVLWKERRRAMSFDFSNPAVVGVVCVVALVIVLAVVWVVTRQRNRRRTEELRARFGPEYDLALREYGSRARTEAALLDRVNRVRRMTIRPLTDAERDRFMEEWEAIQTRFIDHPRGAVTEADELINSILVARGYEGGPFDRRVADLSVYHSNLVEPYRRANGVTVGAGKNEATTEALRNAMILYRSLIEEFLQANAIVVRREAA